MYRYFDDNFEANNGWAFERDDTEGWYDESYEKEESEEHSNSYEDEDED